jgi:hypothetical protein
MTEKTYETWHDLEKAAMLGDTEAVLRLVSAIRLYRFVYVEKISEIKDELKEIEGASLS